MQYIKSTPSVESPLDDTLWKDIPHHLRSLADSLEPSEIEFVLDWLSSIEVIRLLVAGEGL